MKYKNIDEIALQLLPSVYSQAIQNSKESGLFQHSDWRVGIALEAYILAEALLEAKKIHQNRKIPSL